MNINDHTPRTGAGPLLSPRRKMLDKLYAASQYAWIQLADPSMRAQYQCGRATKKSTYALAVADFLNPPKIQSISLEHYTGHACEPIIIRATDDFKVAGVRVALLHSDGTPIEEGEAREHAHTRWRYKTKQTAPPLEHITLVVTAYDIPGNTDQQTIHIPPRQTNPESTTHTLEP